MQALGTANIIKAALQGGFGIIYNKIIYFLNWATQVSDVMPSFTI